MLRSRHGPGVPHAGTFVVLVFLLALIPIGYSVWLRLSVSQEYVDPGRGKQLESLLNDTGSGVANEQISVIGDSYTTGTREGGIGAKNWVSLVASMLQKQRSVDVTVRATGGVGYSQKPAGKLTYGEMVPLAVSPRTQIVVFVGTRNDRMYSDVEGAALGAFRDVYRIAPKAKIIVVGPMWVNADVPPELLADRDAVRAAAFRASAIWVDPVSDRWFFASSVSIGADGIHPTDAGHQFLANRIGPVIASAILDRPPS